MEIMRVLWIILILLFILSVFLIRTILILRLIKLVRVLLDKNLYNVLLDLPLIEVIFKKMKQIEEFRNILSKLSVNELKEITNEATAEIRHRNNARMHNNVRILDAEIRNLLDGVGEGFISGDDYAPERYYSSIAGVKNLRIHIGDGDGKETVRVIIVKLLSPKGKLLPETITIRNKTYRIDFWRSKNYDSMVDY